MVGTAVIDRLHRGRVIIVRVTRYKLNVFSINVYNHRVEGIYKLILKFNDLIPVQTPTVLEKKHYVDNVIIIALNCLSLNEKRLLLYVMIPLILFIRYTAKWFHILAEYNILSI